MEYFMPLLEAVLGSGGTAVALDRVHAAVEAVVGDLGVFGLAVIFKMHRNVFYTFITGIYKDNTVISADLSIVDNTFVLCSRAGIDLGVDHGGFLAELGNTFPGVTRLLSARHLIQGNALNVSGVGIVFASRYTQVQDNSITCPTVAIEADGPLATVRNNLLRGTGEAATPDAGLILVHYRASGLCIAGNRLLGGPGHGILIRESVSGVVIEDNVIQSMQQNGISTANDVLTIRDLQVSRNRLESCQGGMPNASPWLSGALVIGAGQNVQVRGNTLHGNGPSMANIGRFYGIYCEDVNVAEFSNNLVADTALFPGISPSDAGGIRLQALQGEVQIFGNTIRRNRGIGLAIVEGVRGAQQHVLVHGNIFAGEDISLVGIYGVEYLHFQGNQALQAGILNVNIASVYLEAALAIVNGNTVQASRGQWGLSVHPVDLQSRAIITSNLTTGRIHTGLYLLGTLEMAHNLSLP
jgi:hypothetical protein